MSAEPPDAARQPAAAQQEFPCKQCGAKMAFRPGARAIQCPYCGHQNAIPQSEQDVQELGFHEHLARLAEAEPSQTTTTAKCPACGAETTLQPNVTADVCPFCGGHLHAETQSGPAIKPRSLLPFHVTRDQALGAFQGWIGGLWFAPGALKEYARAESSRLNGVYVPYWTYDCSSETFYRGERGEDYWDTERYTTRENGKTVTKTRRVRKTRWYPVSGVVYNSFDDVLILASRSLPRKYADRLEPWDLQSLVPYDERYLAGLRAERYQVDLAAGFQEAQGVMEPRIRQTIRRDIGGDHQRIHSLRASYYNITFKHLLLPVWISAYRFKDRVYRFLVTARTGEVQGERPWSWVKILLLVLAILGVVAAVAILFAGRL
jgi:DNA-directed RNA polymerase subunit RPC12/RpoP